MREAEHLNKRKTTWQAWNHAPGALLDRRRLSSRPPPPASSSHWVEKGSAPGSGRAGQVIPTSVSSSRALRRAPVCQTVPRSFSRRRRKGTFSRALPEARRGLPPRVSQSSCSTRHSRCRDGALVRSQRVRDSRRDWLRA